MLRALSVVAISGGAAVCIGKIVLDRIHHSVGIAPPTEQQLEEEDQEEHALFRHLPTLRRRLAWRQLGHFPTPIHRGIIGSDKNTTFYVKREDLSSGAYGGNKVRTLQHQLAVCESKNPASNIYVCGSGGSNQVVATVVHGFSRLKLRNILPVYVTADVPDLDNTMNMLSVLSFALPEPIVTWGAMSSVVSALWKAINPLSDSFILPPGGNNPSGVLGQISGMLELAEQVLSGEVSDPNHIFLAVGSSCTITGLIIGTALAKHLNLPVFENLTIHGVPIHDGIVKANKNINFSRSTWSSYFPMSIRHSIRSTCSTLVELGGPDLDAKAMYIFEHNVVIHNATDIVGKYGGHSVLSREAASRYDSHGKVFDASGNETRPLWLCGHFTSKAFAVMMKKAEKWKETKGVFLFWQTKSAVQPLGTADEWGKLKIMPGKIKAWANKGKAESSLRVGRVNVDTGDKEDYRHLMTRVDNVDAKHGSRASM